MLLAFVGRARGVFLGAKVVCVTLARFFFLGWASWSSLDPLARRLAARVFGFFVLRFFERLWSHELYFRSA